MQSIFQYLIFLLIFKSVLTFWTQPSPVSDLPEFRLNEPSGANYQNKPSISMGFDNTIGIVLWIKIRSIINFINII